MSVQNVNFNPNLYIEVKNAARYGIRDVEIPKIDTDHDGKITGLELENYGSERLPELTNFFVKKSGSIEQPQPNNNKFAQSTFTKPKEPDGELHPAVGPKILDIYA